MATINLNWVPAGGISQDVQYRSKTQAGAWLTAAAGLPATVSTYSVANLADNTIYEARIISNCDGGAAKASVTVEGVKITCVGPLTTQVTDTTVRISFSHLGGDVSAYRIELKTGTVLVAGVTTLTSSPVYEFTGLTPDTVYDIHVVTLVGSRSYSCNKGAVKTETSVCLAPTGVTAILS